MSIDYNSYLHLRTLLININSIQFNVLTAVNVCYLARTFSSKMSGLKLFYRFARTNTHCTDQTLETWRWQRVAPSPSTAQQSMIQPMGLADHALWRTQHALLAAAHHFVTTTFHSNIHQVSNVLHLWLYEQHHAWLKYLANWCRPMCVKKRSTPVAR